ncbi:hypothetical protein CLOM_g8824, partial [Closterium sp. NIES-68]
LCFSPAPPPGPRLYLRGPWLACAGLCFFPAALEMTQGLLFSPSRLPLREAEASPSPVGSLSGVPLALSPTSQLRLEFRQQQVQVAAIASALEQLLRLPRSAVGDRVACSPPSPAPAPAIGREGFGGSPMDRSPRRPAAPSPAPPSSFPSPSRLPPSPRPPSPLPVPPAPLAPPPSRGFAGGPDSSPRGVLQPPPLPPPKSPAGPPASVGHGVVSGQGVSAGSPPPPFRPMKRHRGGGVTGSRAG